VRRAWRWPVFKTRRCAGCWKPAAALSAVLIFGTLPTYGAGDRGQSYTLHILLLSGILWLLIGRRMSRILARQCPPSIPRQTGGGLIPSPVLYGEGRVGAACRKVL